MYVDWLTLTDDVIVSQHIIWLAHRNDEMIKRVTICDLQSHVRQCNFDWVAEHLLQGKGVLEKKMNKVGLVRRILHTAVKVCV